MGVRLFADSNFLDFSVRNSLPNDINPIEMSLFDTAFLCGLLKRFKPKKILEVGVSAGGSSVVILTAMNKYNLDATLTSVDINKLFYKNFDCGTKYRTGYLAERIFGKDPRWKLFTGKYLAEVIEEFDYEFDFCILDTVHGLPGELLDYPVIVKFLKKNGVFVIHDVNYHHLCNIEGHSNALVYAVSAGNKIYCLDPEGKQWRKLANIGAVVANDDTLKYICNAFLAMSMPWKNFIDVRQFEIYYKFYRKHYGDDCAKMFMLAYEANNKKFFS